MTHPSPLVILRDALGVSDDWLLSMCVTREMKHQDQQELAEDGGPEQHATPVHSDETRLTQ